MSAVDDGAIARGEIRVIGIKLEEMDRKLDASADRDASQGEVLADMRAQQALMFKAVNRIAARQDTQATELREIRKDVDDARQRIGELERWRDAMPPPRLPSTSPKPRRRTPKRKR